MCLKLEFLYLEAIYQKQTCTFTEFKGLILNSRDGKQRNLLPLSPGKPFLPGDPGVPRGPGGPITPISPLPPGSTAEAVLFGALESPTFQIFLLPSLLILKFQPEIFGNSKAIG